MMAVWFKISEQTTVYMLQNINIKYSQNWLQEESLYKLNNSESIRKIWVSNVEPRKSSRFDVSR